MIHHKYNTIILRAHASVAILEKNWNLGHPALDIQMAIQRVEIGSPKSFIGHPDGDPARFEVDLRLRGHPDGDPAWKSIEDQLEVRELRQKRASDSEKTLFGEYESSQETTYCFTCFYQNLNIMCCNDTFPVL